MQGQGDGFELRVRGGSILTATASAEAIKREQSGPTKVTVEGLVHGTTAADVKVSVKLEGNNCPSELDLGSVSVFLGVD